MARQASLLGEPWRAVTNADSGPEVTVEPGADRALWSREVNYQVWHCDDEQDGCPESARGWIAEAEHIAEHDPVRVLRDVRAKRIILDELSAAIEAADEDPNDPVCTSDVAELWVIARALASVYSHRPGFRQEWWST